MILDTDKSICLFSSKNSLKMVFALGQTIDRTKEILPQTYDECIYKKLTEYNLSRPLLGGKYDKHAIMDDQENFFDVIYNERGKFCPLPSDYLTAEILYYPNPWSEAKFPLMKNSTFSMSLELEFLNPSKETKVFQLNRNKISTYKSIFFYRHMHPTRGYQ